MLYVEGVSPKNVASPKLSPQILKDFRTFLEYLPKLGGSDLQPDFEPYDLGTLLLANFDDWSVLRSYLRVFRSDPERSGEFHYDIGKWNAVVAALYMGHLRTRSDLR